jgi:hypothetical protein
MAEVDILAELFHAVSMAVFCVGLLFCLACVIDARGAYSEDDDRT